MRLVKAVAAVARSIAFLKRAVAISSIVRVILRMLRIDLRRLSSTLGFAIASDVAEVAKLRIALEWPNSCEFSYELYSYGFAFGLFLFLRCAVSVLSLEFFDR